MCITVARSLDINKKANLISVHERVEDSSAPVHAVLVDLLRLWVAFDIETMKNFDSVRQSRSPCCHDAGLQAVTHSTFHIHTAPHA